MKIKSVKDVLVEVEGEYNYLVNEIVTFSNGKKGIVIKATTKKAFIALFENSINNPIKVGDDVKGTGEEFSLKISESQFGNIINIYGEKMTHYNNSKFNKNFENKYIFKVAKPIYARNFVNEPLKTGIAAIDWAIPIGKGQRELILGDRETGKSSIALNMIMAQKNTNVKTIYVAIGQKKTTILSLYKKIKKNKLQDKVIILAVAADQTSTKKWLAPYVGATIAEYFQEKNGDDLIVIYDDLSKHADAYRELSLIAETSPSREAYPGDIFYSHSQLLERAGKFNDDFGGGSITAIPIVQTEAGDITSYIPTNIISITDGQIFTNKKLFNSGYRPAIDISYSVSRVGSMAQTKSLARVSSGLKMLISHYNEAKQIAKLSPTALEEHKDILEKGKVLMALLIQPELDVLDYETGGLIIQLFKEGYLNFFTKNEEIKLIREIINDFIKKDFLGKKLRKIIQTQEINNDHYSLYINEIILPIIKFHLLDKYPYLKKENKFIKLFKHVRDDGRVFKNLFKNMKGYTYA